MSLSHAETRKRLSGQRQGSHQVEWVVGTISAIATAALLVYLAYQAVTGQQTPPRFDLLAGPVEHVGNSFYVPVRVTNRGASAAANVVIAAQPPGQDREAPTITFDYVPADSTRRGTFVFLDDPGPAERLQVEVTSYREP